ncbi:compound eye opsin BCRH2-like [Daphnia pulicaria]|uniref:compound eye opsin BCRH2-like n=1 Tax=Daphnia pulicaria TaxID=35523 RepID=UPI001EEA12CB|nr:compound eye opsin BCRH2-like [Daphnia pulicaria]
MENLLLNASVAYRSAGKPPVVWGFPPGASIIDTVPEDMLEMIHPHWKKFPPVNPMWHYLLGLIYIVLGITSITGNSLVLHLFMKTKDLRTPANMFVVNLAFSDVCMMITQFPMFVLNCFNGGVWLFGPLFCELYACTGSIFGLCSICTMAAISYDRYNVIVNGMNGTRMTFGRAALFILFCWVYAIGWSIPPFVGWGKYIPEGILDSCSFDYLTRDTATISFTCCLFVFDYCFPLIIIVYCYYHIVGAIVHHEKALREQAKKMNVSSLRSNSDQTAQSAEIRVAKIAMMNISLWVAAWTPYAAICLQGAVGNQDTITPLVTILPALIAKSASIFNPIIYAISHPKYRLALQKTVPWFCINETAPPASSGGDTQSQGSACTSATS